MHATWCCLFEILTLPRALCSNDICAWIRQFLFGDVSRREQDAGVLVVLNAARPEREDSKVSHWRQPLTSDSQAFVPEMTILHHPIGRATDIRTRQE